jgi:hypothetical protein
MLIAVDDSGHSARVLRDARDVQVPLFHVLKPMPRELLDQVVPGATLDIGAQKLVGHVPVPEEKRRVRGEPLLELQTVVAVVEDRIIDIDEPVRFMESSLGPSVEVEEERITSSEGSQMTSDNCVGRSVGRLGSSLNFRRRAAENWSHHRCTKPCSQQWRTIPP